MTRICVKSSHLAAAELRKDFVKKAPGQVAEAAAPVRSLAPPPTNMAQANNARGEGKVKPPLTCLAFSVLTLLVTADKAGMYTLFCTTLVGPMWAMLYLSLQSLWVLNA